MHSIKLLRPARLALLLLLALPVAPGFAEDKPAPGTAQPAPRDPYDRNIAISIDFPGGPFSKLVATLKGEKMSIIQSAGVDPILPAFSVSNAPISSVIVALGRIIEPQGYMLDVTGPNVAVLTRLPEHRGQGFASLPMEGKIGPRAAEDVITAIQQGCEFASEGKPSTLRFKYHPGTKLLFVAGSEREVDIAHRVFGSLPNVAPPREPAYTPAPDKK